MADAGKAVNVRKAARKVLLRDHAGGHEEALARADKLAKAHPESALALRVAGDLHCAAAIRARRAFRHGAEGVLDEQIELHLSISRQVLSTASRLVPDCVDVSISLGDTLTNSSMLREAEVEYNRALSIPLPIDPVLHNAEYGLYGRERSTVNARVQEARARARRAYDALKKQLIDIGVKDAFELAEGTTAAEALLRENPGAAAADVQKARLEAALKARKNATSIANQFPFSARAQCLHGYLDLLAVRDLNEAISKRSVLERSTLEIADRAVLRFPNSVVFICFRAKIYFILGEFDAAERDCRRGLNMEKADDPGDECIPLGAISGPNQGARLVAHASQFFELLNKILLVAKDYWSSMAEERKREFYCVRLDDLQEENIGDQLSISDVQNIVKKRKSWRHWVCPLCDNYGKKFTDTVSLLSHMCSKHPRAVLPRLQSILDGTTAENALDEECSPDWLTFSQDSDQHDIVCFKERDNMFGWLFYRPSNGVKPKPFAEGLENRCNKCAMLLEDIKEKLKTLATDELSTEFAEALPRIKELWLDFVKSSVVDYREFILSRARSFVWKKLKKCMTDDPELSSKRISAADIDEMLAIVSYNPDNIAVKEKTEAHKSSHSDQAQKINENHQESDFHAEDKSFGTMVNTELQNPPTSMDENENKLVEQVENLKKDPNTDRSVTPQCTSSNHNGVTCRKCQSSTPNENSASHIPGTSGQFSEEAASISIHEKSVDVLNQNSEDILFLHLIIQTIWNLRSLRDDYLKRPPACFQSSHDGSCIADLLYEIFSAWEKNDHQRIAYLLTSLKINLCQIVNDNNIFQKLRAGKSFASDILAIVIKGLHTSEASLHFCFDDKVQGQVVNPITCEDCICRVHDLFGMSFLLQTSCRCGACFDEKEYTTVFRKLDVCSPQTTKIKSFADLPVLMDEQLCYDYKCQSCGNLKNIDHFPLNTPHFVTVVLNCVDGSESQVSLSEILVGSTTSALDITLLHKDVDPSTKYTLASVICCSDGRYVCISRDQKKWLVYDTKTIKAEYSWERVLQNLTDSELRPEVLFFEAIK